MEKLISVIMPTYNSGSTIRASLDSIRNQDFDQNLIEILVLDGGSKDETVKIAKEYNCKIVDNKMTNPESAKHMGINVASGKYLLFLDSDEAIENKNSLATRVKAMSKYDIKILFSGGFKPPKNSSIANKYVSLFADPFSYFIYGISPDSDSFLADYLNKYPRRKIYDNFVIFELLKETPLPLLDTAGGTMVDVNFLKKVFPKVYTDPTLFSQITQKLMRESKSITVLKNDPIIHESVKSLRRYLFKLRWKVKVNVVFKNSHSSGFSKRESYQNVTFNFKKYLFLPFALTLVGPTLVGLYFFIFRKKVAGILHPFLTFYVAFFIIYYFLLTLFGVKLTLPILGNPAPSIKTG